MRGDSEIEHTVLPGEGVIQRERNAGFGQCDLLRQDNPLGMILGFFIRCVGFLWDIIAVPHQDELDLESAFAAQGGIQAVDFCPAGPGIEHETVKVSIKGILAVFFALQTAFIAQEYAGIVATEIHVCRCKRVIVRKDKVLQDIHGSVR